MVHQWGFFGSISAIRKIWSLTANSRSLQAAALNTTLLRLFIENGGSSKLEVHVAGFQHLMGILVVNNWPR